jgi:cytochrome P450
MTHAEDDGGSRTSRLTAPAHASGALARSAGGDWLASRYADVQAILSDSRFGVPAVADDGAAVGTLSWLRASVSRFANGGEHEQRRAVVVGQLHLLDPQTLRRDCGERTRAELARAGRSGQRVDLMARIARQVPMATMAAMLGAADPELAAQAVVAIAAGYFGTTDAQIASEAGAATVRLVSMLDPGDLAAAVACITLMVQACDATAGLIGGALHALQDTPSAGPGWSTGAVLSEVLRYSPPVKAIRRVACSPAAYGEQLIAAGDTVLSSVDSANRDPAVFESADVFDPARHGPASLTFGYGIRPCPGQDQALMLAAGLIDAVRERCALRPGTPIDYLTAAPLRIPRHLEVTLR